MSIQRNNANMIKEAIDSAIKLDPILQEAYQNLDTSIREESDGSCILHVSEMACCRCSPDGSVWLLNDPTTQPFVGHIPVLLPLNRDSFLIAMLYIGDLNALFLLRRKGIEILSKKENPGGFKPPAKGGLIS